MQKKYCVQYVSGYLGWGVNKYERKYFYTQEEADKEAEILKSKNAYDVQVYKLEN